MKLYRLGLAFGAAAFCMSAHAQLGQGPNNIPAGLACEFPLTIDVSGGVQVHREFLDRSGNVVRTIDAGKGSKLTFINDETSAQLSTRPNGSVTQTRLNPDGSQTISMTGHNILILFPGDIPAGPSTTLYVGRVVFSVDPTGVFTLLQSNGKSSDICAALS